MKQTHRKIHAIALLALISLGAVPAALADTTMPAQELPGIEEVFNLISGVNLNQEDFTASEPILDMLDLKDQMYQLQKTDAVTAEHRATAQLASQVKKKPAYR